MSATLLSFHNVGTRTFERTDPVVDSTSVIPFGIKTPLELDGTGADLFVMNMTLADQVTDNLRNLIQTNWGERVGNYRFGGNLRELLMEYTNMEDFNTEAMTRINTAVSEYMPYVDLFGYESTPLETALIRIVITYNIPALNVQNRSMELILQVI